MPTDRADLPTENDGEMVVEPWLLSHDDVVTEPPQLEYHVVDVFTERPFAGNPLAVVLSGEALSTHQMQSIASEFQLSETAFPHAPVRSPEARAAGADYRLRIFTPDTELPFAGHPSIGSAWVLHQQGWFGAGVVQQLCGEGLLPISVDATGATLTGGAARVGEEIDPTPALSAVGLSAPDLHGAAVRVASTGLAFAILPVRVEAIDRCEPDVGLLRRHFSYPSDATGIYVVSWGESPRSVQARMFAGDIGSPEDAATGSGALALGAYLGTCGFLPDGSSVVEITQGVQMRRPSSLHVTVDVREGHVQSVRVAGEVVPVAHGRISIPPEPRDW